MEYALFLQSNFYPDWNFIWFTWVNETAASAVLDAVLPVVRNKWIWTPLYILLLVYLWKAYKRKALWAILAIAGSFALANTLSAEVAKPYFAQPRPCHEETTEVSPKLRVKCGPGKSFPSAHATNHFAIAWCLSLLFWHKHKWVLPVGLFWAATISYAQVYVGVHYPVDVMAGALLGSVCGWLGFLLVCKRWRAKG